MAGGSARQETGKDEVGPDGGAGAAGVLVAAAGAAEGVEGDAGGVDDPHAAMTTAPNGARNRCALGMVEEPLLGIEKGVGLTELPGNDPRHR